ncbi:MAG: hypothetical protein KC964_31435, partial [Candidatus Omnitrophica bacterium]|nr:hypothetical protein [Candidatus Omnitrophota bacterium]
MLLLGKGSEPDDIRIAAWGMALGSLLFATLAAVDCGKICGIRPREILSLVFNTTWPLLLYLGWTYWAIGQLEILREGVLEMGPWTTLILSSLALFTPVALLGLWRIWGEVRGSE